MSDSQENIKSEYEQSGVSSRGAEDALSGLLKHVLPTRKFSKGYPLAADIGYFANVIDIGGGQGIAFGTDGVGTKIELAREMGKFDTIGIDLVAMCVNDLVTCGAEPLLFLDYYVTDSLNVELASKVVQGIAEGCKQANCSLVAGETAEHPNSFPANSFDLAGFALGVVDENKMIGKELAENVDILLG